jgi:16S rRNA (adenine1518-N6/adenine1519-N6)-dimethyltransferase
VRIVEADALSQPVSRLLDPPYRVAGNIPYNLTGALLVHLLEQVPPPRRIDVVVQREVALRVAAPPGSWSLATLAVRVYGRAEVALTIPREAFYPAPEVASALLRIIPQAEPALPRERLQAFFAFARPFFQSRRKQLANTLAQVAGVDKAQARERLRLCGIDPRRRPETLDLAEWGELFRRQGPNGKAAGN